MIICPSCNFKCADCIKYCPRCNRYLGNVEKIPDPKPYKGPQSMNQKSNTPVVECPYCHSTNTTKISISHRFIGNVDFAAFSKQWHCNSCDSDF